MSNKTDTIKTILADKQIFTVDLKEIKMKEYVTIKLEKKDVEHLKEWIKNTIEVAKYVRPEAEWIEWQKKMLKIIKKQEDNLSID